jgi:hypothetical protein
LATKREKVDTSREILTRRARWIKPNPQVASVIPPTPGKSIDLKADRTAERNSCPISLVAYDHGNGLSNPADPTRCAIGDLDRAREGLVEALERFDCAICTCALAGMDLHTRFMRSLRRIRKSLPTRSRGSNR